MYLFMQWKRLSCLDLGGCHCPAPTFSTLHFFLFLPLLVLLLCSPACPDALLRSSMPSPPLHPHCSRLVCCYCLTFSFSFDFSSFSSLCFPFHCPISLIIDLYLCSILIFLYCYCFVLLFLIFLSLSHTLITWIPVQSGRSFPHLLLPLLFNCPMLRLLYLVHFSHSWFSSDLGRFGSISPSLRLAFSCAGLLQLYI